MFLLRHTKFNRIITKKCDIKEISTLLRKSNTLITLSFSFKKRYFNVIIIEDVRL